MKWAGLLVLIAGLALFLFTDDLRLSTPSNNKTLRILKVEGDVLGKNTSQSKFKTLSKGSDSTLPYKVMTGFESRTLIQFGEEFWINPNSLVRMEERQKKKEVHLISGSIKRKKKGSTLFFVEGLQQNTLILEQAGKTQLTQIPIEESLAATIDTHQQPALKAADSKQIYQTFRLHQRFIEKCFIKHYSRTEGQTRSGKVWVIFNVNKKGQLESPDIKKSDYSDEEFHACLKEVITRVRLKNYSGPTVQIQFPINIALPE